MAPVSAFGHRPAARSSGSRGSACTARRARPSVSISASTCARVPRHRQRVVGEDRRRVRPCSCRRSIQAVRSRLPFMLVPSIELITWAHSESARPFQYVDAVEGGVDDRQGVGVGPGRADRHVAGQRFGVDARAAQVVAARAGQVGGLAGVGAGVADRPAQHVHLVRGARPGLVEEELVAQLLGAGVADVFVRAILGRLPVRGRRQRGERVPLSRRPLAARRRRRTTSPLPTRIPRRPRPPLPQTRFVKSACHLVWSMAASLVSSRRP